MTMQAWSPDPGGANYGSGRQFCVGFRNFLIVLNAADPGFTEVIKGFDGSFRNSLFELNSGSPAMNIDEKQRGTILTVREKHQNFLSVQLKRLSYCSKIEKVVQIYFSVYGNA